MGLPTVSGMYSQTMSQLGSGAFKDTLPSSADCILPWGSTMPEALVRNRRLGLSITSDQLHEDRLYKQKKCSLSPESH